MAVHKLKPIEERDPYAAAVLEAFDSLGDKMNPIERELKTMRGFAACLHDEHCLDEADKELARLLAIEAAARNLIAALDKLDEGCRQTGFRGFHNGNGEPCGDEAKSTREALAALLVNGPLQGRGACAESPGSGGSAAD